MKKSKQDFFVQMKNYKIANINKQYNIAQAIVYVTMFVFLVVIELMSANFTIRAYIALSDSSAAASQGSRM